MVELATQGNDRSKAAAAIHIGCRTAISIDITLPCRLRRFEQGGIVSRGPGAGKNRSQFGIHLFQRLHQAAVYARGGFHTRGTRIRAWPARGLLCSNARR